MNISNSTPDRPITRCLNGNVSDKSLYAIERLHLCTIISPILGRFTSAKATLPRAYTTQSIFEGVKGVKPNLYP